MVNVERMCNDNQEERVLSTEAYMSFTFIKTTGLPAFEVVNLLHVVLNLQASYKNAWIAIKVKVKVVFSRVCFNRRQT